MRQPPSCAQISRRAPAWSAGYRTIGAAAVGHGLDLGAADPVMVVGIDGPSGLIGQAHEQYL
jgi:hypothetical protein